MNYAFEKETDKLVFELKNSQPIELVDLTKSLTAVANQYRRFVVREDLHEETDAKLYVKEVRNGSTIVELFAYIQAHETAVVGIGATAIAGSKSVIDFALYLKKSFEELRGGKKPSAELAKKDLDDLSKILEPTAKDPGGQLSFHADRGGTINVSLTLPNDDANVIQNQTRRMIDASLETEQREFFKRSFYWDTASKGGPRTTDKGIIETIETRPVPVIFDDASIKARMIAGKAHPFATLYIVDVELITARGKTKAYKITNLHDVIEDDEEG